MAIAKPSASILWRAIDIYLAHAYTAPPPAAVRERLDTLRAADPKTLYESPVFERTNGRSQIFMLRLGNEAYPHMKIKLQLGADGKGYVFAADSHDPHLQPAPRSRDAIIFQSLKQQNHALAKTIETAWAAQGVPTASGI